MKELKFLVLAALFLAVSQLAFAQTAQQPLKIGDQVPDLEFTNLINTDKKVIKLSDYKGKLVILDFFATWCVPCVRAIPKLDSLQKEFKDQLVILPVTSESEKVMQQFSKTRPELMLSLPYVYKTNLQNYFPYRLLPLEAWIDADGKVIGLTDGEAVTRENIVKILKKDKMQLPKKQDILDRDDEKPFMAGFFGSYKFKPEQILYSSMLTEGFEGMPGMSQTMPYVKDGISYLAASNNFVIKLYWIALLDVDAPSMIKGRETNPDFYTKKEFYKWMLNRQIWEAKDSSLFWGNENKDVVGRKPYKEVLFNYELRLPQTDSKTFKTVMLSDLNRFFGMKYGIEGLLQKRKVKCYALSVNGPEKLFKTRGEKEAMKLERGIKEFKVSNQKIDDIMFFWTNFHIPYFPIPIINETNYDLPVDFDLGDVDPSDFYAVNARLKRFGLEFKLVERELDMIIIRDTER